MRDIGEIALPRPVHASGLLLVSTQYMGVPLNHQLQVLDLAASGHTDLEIGGRLYVAERTVKNNKQSVVQTLGARTTMEAARIALEGGMIPLDETLAAEADLSVRQTEAVDLLTRGPQSEQLAADYMGVKLPTFRKHRSHAYKCLHISKRAALPRVAYAAGVFPPVPDLDARGRAMSEALKLRFVLRAAYASDRVDELDDPELAKLYPAASLILRRCAAWNDWFSEPIRLRPNGRWNDDLPMRRRIRRAAQRLGASLPWERLVAST